MTTIRQQPLEYHRRSLALVVESRSVSPIASLFDLLTPCMVPCCTSKQFVNVLSRRLIVFSVLRRQTSRV